LKGSQHSGHPVFTAIVQGLVREIGKGARTSLEQLQIQLARNPCFDLGDSTGQTWLEPGPESPK
jgi:hypothetical protein